MDRLKVMGSEPADWKQCLTWALACFVGAVASFVGSDRLRGAGGVMTTGAAGLLVVSVAALAAGLFSLVLAIVRHPPVRRWRYWKAGAAFVFVAVAALGGVWAYQRLSEFGQGILFGIAVLSLLEGLRRLGFGYYLNRKLRRAPGALANFPRREDYGSIQEHAAAIAQRVADGQRGLEKMSIRLELLKREFDERGVDLYSVPDRVAEAIFTDYLDEHAQK